MTVTRNSRRRGAARRAFVAVGCAVAAFAVAACGGTATAAGSGSAPGTTSAGATAAASGAAAAPQTLVYGSPGIPPTMGGLLQYVTQQAGFYQKFGVKVTIKNFQTGADALRAASTGEVDLSTGSPSQIAGLASQGVPVVAVFGMQVPDWTIASTNPAIKTCADLKGQSLGVDAIKGIRYTALEQMLATCGLTIDDVHPLVFPGNQNPQAMIAGQLKVSVLELNEVAKVEDQTGKPLTVVMTMANSVPDQEYNMTAALRSDVARKRTAFVRMVAAQIAALKWIDDPANAAKVAQFATVVGDSEAVMRKAMAQYQKIGFWSTDSSGMPQANVDNAIKAGVASGQIKAGHEPAYSSWVDNSIYTDAQKLAAGTG